MSVFKVDGLCLLRETNLILCLTAVPWFGRLVAGLLMGRPEFNPEPVHMRFVLKLLWDWLFLEYFRFPLSVSFHLCSLFNRNTHF